LRESPPRALFLRTLELAVAHERVRYGALVLAAGKLRQLTSIPRWPRIHPTSVERETLTEPGGNRYDLGGCG
jgi:hypothetical protein